MFGGSSKPKFDANKTKVNLKMLINRFNLLTQKKSNLAKQQKRQVALLLKDDKEPNAAQTCVWVCGPERCPAVAHTRAGGGLPRSL